MANYREDKETYDWVFNKTLDFFDDASKYKLSTRDGQISMSSEIINALSENKNLIVEAGVGIGKSYAYLIPLMYLNNYNNCKIVISTSTIALQEQLVKDIEKLQSLLKVRLNFVVAKGKTNFLCIDRAAKESISFDIERQDRKDNLGISESNWKKICVDDCKFNSCAYKDNCQFYFMRWKMNIYNLVICNHNLLIVDLLKSYGRNLLNNPKVIVCDEAHNLEDKFRDYYTKSVNIKSVIRDLNKLRGLHADNIIKSIIKSLNLLNLYFKREALLSIDKLISKGIDIVDCDELGFDFNKDIKNEVNRIISLLRDLDVRIFSGFNFISQQKEDLAEATLYSIIELFNHFIDVENNIYWISKSKNDYTVNFVPMNIKKYSRIALTSSNKNFILTSATLSTENNQYDYILNGLGLDDESYETVEPESSTFNYNDSLLYLCSDLPNPKDKEKYLEELYKKIIELISLTKGKTLVLFTSKYDMNYVYEKIKDEMSDMNLFIQNNGSSQEAVKEKFKKDINSVLFSTGTFWEGIDVKGVSLSSVIIARLPFPVVTPYLEHKAEEEGYSVYLNEMLIKLKQGCGRLVRSETDKGLISILDSRVMKKNYLDSILNILPDYKITTSMDEVTEYISNNIVKQKKLINKNK